MKQPKTKSGGPPLSAKDIIITKAEATRWLQVKGAQSALDNLHGEGAWGVEEAIEYFQETRWRKWQKFMGDIGAEPDAELQDCVDNYLESFDNPTPNDIQGIMNLCALERQLADVRFKLRGQVNAGDLKDLTKTQKDLMQEHRLQQGALGIERKTRRGEERTALDAIQEEIDKGRQFVEEKLIPIEHCNIQLGWVLYHFRELPHKFEFRCPRCGAPVLVEGGDIANLEISLEKVIDLTQS